MKAIETVYNGYRFRSRLEARWAVFFDALEIRYQYESEGFDLDNDVRYLPDFYLPSTNSGITPDGEPPPDDNGIWLEIKATKEQIKRDIDKLAKFGSLMPHRFYIILGSPYSGDYRIISFIRAKIFIELEAFPYWVYCKDCDKYTIGWIAKEPFPTVVYCGNCQTFQVIEDPGKFCLEVTCTPKLFNAWNTARQARFEHGHNGT